MLDFFKKKQWSKWQHVLFVENYADDIPTYEILRRECALTGLTQYKRIYVSRCVHNLASMMKNWFDNFPPSVF